MNRYFHKLEVGKPFDLFANIVHFDSCIMEVMNDGTFMLVIFLRGMSNIERELLRKGTINTRIIENGNLILPLVRFNNSDLIFEINFNPFLYKDERKILAGKSNMVNIIGIELIDYTVQTIRFVNMPLKLYSKYITNWNLGDPLEYSKQYITWVDELQSKYSVLDLWNMGQYIGRFGEK